MDLFDRVPNHADPLSGIKQEHSESPRPSKRSRKLSVSPRDNVGGRSQSSPHKSALYKAKNGAKAHDEDEELEKYSPLHNLTTSSLTNRGMPSIKTYTVQCSRCLKWRIVPSKEKYEEIRECILQHPFTCERARAWRSLISCEDPEDISQDGSRLWAIDKPNIAQPPPGWERLISIRGEGATKFADVYYTAPNGKKLRSMVEIEKYLAENPDFLKKGVNLAQFSFLIPRPLQENYVKKRASQTHPGSADGAASGLFKPDEPLKVTPLAWVPSSQEG